MKTNFSTEEYYCMCEYFGGFIVFESYDVDDFLYEFYEEEFIGLHKKWRLDEEFYTKVKSMSDEDLIELKLFIADFWAEPKFFRIIAMGFAEHGICSGIERPKEFDLSFYDNYEPDYYPKDSYIPSNSWIYG